MYCSRQEGHQQAAFAPGTATTGGSLVHQHGSSEPSAIAQPNWAPQRVHMLMKMTLNDGEDTRIVTIVNVCTGHVNGSNQNFQQDSHIMRTGSARLP
jgi:hypothetical protein